MLAGHPRTRLYCTPRDGVMARTTAAGRRLDDAGARLARTGDGYRQRPRGRGRGGTPGKKRAPNPPPQRSGPGAGCWSVLERALLGGGGGESRHCWQCECCGREARPAARPAAVEEAMKRVAAGGWCCGAPGGFCGRGAAQRALLCKEGRARGRGGGTKVVMNSGGCLSREESRPATFESCRGSRRFLMMTWV